MRSIKMKLPGNEVRYYVGENIFSKLPALLKKRGITDSVFVVADSKVKKNYAGIFDMLASEFSRFDLLSIKADEVNKSHKGLSRIYSRMIQKKFGRDTTLIAIGGGVIGDLAGFAAATFSRGIRLVHVPTTLLAMVDSSIGGKTGINFEGIKNIVGSFYMPEFILSDINFLSTLPRAELVSGLGEITKYGILTDEKLFEFVNKNAEKIISGEISLIKKAVFESAKIKISVVEQDEKENGMRKILNLGHTFAHAFEAVSNYRLAHGKAVLIGIYAAFLVSESLGFCDTEIVGRYADFLSRLKKEFPKLEFPKKKTYSVMLNDKKNRDGKIKFVLPLNFGLTALDVEVPGKTVLATLETVGEFLKR